MIGDKMGVQKWMDEKYKKDLVPCILESLKVTTDHIKYMDQNGYIDRENERIRPWNIGEIVEICTTFMIGENVNTTLRKIIGGFLKLKNDLETREDEFWEGKNYPREEYQKMYLEDKKFLAELKNVLTVKGLNFRSVYLICRLIKYIELVRGPAYKKFFWARLPDDSTIENILAMTNRSVEFLSKFNFPENKLVGLSHASEVVNMGGFDFCSENVFFDMKVRNDYALTEKDVIQQICTFVLSKRLGYVFDKCIIFNPRWGVYYEFNIEDIPANVLEFIETNI